MSELNQKLTNTDNAHKKAFIRVKITHVRNWELKDGEGVLLKSVFMVHMQAVATFW